MATIVLGAVGASLGASLGGSVLGLSTAVLGRAAGATIGRVVDQRLMGSGSEVVETGRVDRLRLTGASEGAAVQQVYGRMRVSGQVIWSSRFQEQKSTKKVGGKGSAPSQKVNSYSYSISVAIALCEGQIADVGRIWADGREIPRKNLNLRVYNGSSGQLPDPKIAAVEGADNAPSYRGVAYVVVEDLQLDQFGNRVPQFSFEVLRPAQKADAEGVDPLNLAVKGVALLPGSGDYTLATSSVFLDRGMANRVAANRNSGSGQSDFSTSLASLQSELPNCGSTLLVVSWFGDDLRCNHTTLKPKAEQTLVDSTAMPWSVSDRDRLNAEEVARKDGRPIYGGTPTDASVVEAIRALRNSGKEVVFYPFILMDQLESNGRPDPWTNSAHQPVLPWRGRITTSLAPNQIGTPQGTLAARDQVASFFGTVSPDHFQISNGQVGYSGPNEWSYRRFILHYAALCKAAGGVDAFCIGSEMRGLTQIMAENNCFPAVEELVRLAADVRQILGISTKLSYAADWSEYFGFIPQDGSGSRFFHLDPLWADENIDFIGIDNYMPVSDWRHGMDHGDADWGSPYDIGYLQSNIEGGEGYDWYYADRAGRDAQDRLPISDGTYGEPWVWRYKDIKSWWSLPHHDRIDGVRSTVATAWVPQSKPIWFTEFGCAAIDKGANQPNKFLDPKSSESSLPYYSSGRRDDLMQMQYIRAVQDYWERPTNNPMSTVYSGRMLDTSKSHVWAWDARPYPNFPALTSVWSDGENYSRGHWLNGRATGRHLADVVQEICARSGVYAIETQDLHGYVRGYTVPDLDGARSALQPLMLAHGFDATEVDGVLKFRSRTGRPDVTLSMDELAVHPEQNGDLLVTRQPESEMASRVQVAYVAADGQYDARTTEAMHPGEDNLSVSQSELNMSLSFGEASRMAERWLSEARVSRDSVSFALPPSYANLTAGDVVEIAEDRGHALYRIDRIEDFGILLVEAVRVEPGIYNPGGGYEEGDPLAVPPPVALVFPVFMDLPLLRGDEVPHAPFLAVASDPWPGDVAVFSSSVDSDYGLNGVVDESATLGLTLNTMKRAQHGLIDRGAPLQIDLSTGEFNSVERELLLNGANALAISDGRGGDWEIFQFQNAELIGDDVYAVSLRLRGQQGTDAFIPDVWPAGSLVVLLDDAITQMDVTAASRGLSRHYRIGPANEALDSVEYTHLEHAADGTGLRPYSPTHLSVETSNGTHKLSWVRRTRIGGDDWSLEDVPLGETRELYRVAIRQGGTTKRLETVTVPQFDYTAAMRAEDGVSGLFAVEVAQVSDLYGPGPSKRIEIYA